MTPFNVFEYVFYLAVNGGLLSWHLSRLRAMGRGPKGTPDPLAWLTRTCIGCALIAICLCAGRLLAFIAFRLGGG